MKLNRQEKEIVRRKFCAYCIKVLHGEALNYLDELERKRKREVNFSELLQKDLDALYCCDDYDMAENFTSLLENENRNMANHFLMCQFVQNEFWVINLKKKYYHFHNTHNITLDNHTFLLVPNKCNYAN